MPRIVQLRASIICATDPGPDMDLSRLRQGVRASWRRLHRWNLLLCQHRIGKVVAQHRFRWHALQRGGVACQFLGPHRVFSRSRLRFAFFYQLSRGERHWSAPPELVLRWLSISG